MAELIQALTDGGYKALREATGECPSCILAALRQAPPHAGQKFKEHPEQTWDGATLPAWKEYEPDGRDEFDYQKELKEQWAMVNEDWRAAVGYIG